MKSAEIETPLVSVVIPTFNSVAYIEEALHSVVNQSYKNIEIIVVDDSSTDTTLAIVINKSKDEPRLRYYSIPHSGRPAVPRNFGIKQAKGEYVAFLDSDDVWVRNKLELQIDALTKNPLYALVYSMSITFGSVDIFSPYYEVLPLLHKVARNRNELIAKGNCISTSSILIRKSLLEKVGAFDEDAELSAIEDYDLWLRLGEYTNYLFIPRILVYYRIHSTQISDSWEIKQQRLDVLAKSRNIPLRPYQYFRIRSWAMRMMRNAFHYGTSLLVKLLALIDRIA